MKEATGEANMTVITVVLIAVVLGVGSVIIGNMLDSVENSTECMEKGLCGKAGACEPCRDVNTTGTPTENP